MNWAVVMCGGKGTRFWPESRAKHPKPFLKLIGRKTLLEETVHRLSPLFPPERIVIVLQDTLVREAQRLFPRIPKQNFLGEPIGRNTAPCCVFAASRIDARDPDAKIVFLPADQHIFQKALYLKTLKAAFQIVDERPVLLGMKPDSPQTGYGYLELGRKGRKIHGITYFTVRRFREKPSLAQAKRFLKRGNVLWNGGTFVWRLDAFKRAVKKYAPRIYSVWDRLSKIHHVYKRLPSISLDYAVMEKMKQVHCLQAPFQWSDLGGWLGLARFWPSDAAKNRIRVGARRAVPLLVHSHNNIVKSDKRLIALLGIQDLLVIDSGDALLISPRAKAEDIRLVVRELERRKASKYL